jgi:hypothetical protein
MVAVCYLRGVLGPNNGLKIFQLELLYIDQSSN